MVTKTLTADAILQPFMKDPASVLRELLKNSWSLVGDLAQANVVFGTGWYDDALQTPQVTVIESSERDEPFELGYGTVRVYADYQIDVWIKVVKTTNKGRAWAKNALWKCRREVKRILQGNLTGLEGLKYVILNDAGRRLDEPNRKPPLLRWSKIVPVIYDNKT